MKFFDFKMFKEQKNKKATQKPNSISTNESSGSDDADYIGRVLDNYFDVLKQKMHEDIRYVAYSNPDMPIWNEMYKFLVFGKEQLKKEIASLNTDVIKKSADEVYNGAWRFFNEWEQLGRQRERELRQKEKSQREYAQQPEYEYPIHEETEYDDPEL